MADLCRHNSLIPVKTDSRVRLVQALSNTVPMNEGEERDRLAVERTLLANERTLLAYVRTALALAGGGAALLQFFPGQPYLLIIAWLLLVSGVATAIIGLRRFYVVRRAINASAAEPTH